MRLAPRGCPCENVLQTDCSRSLVIPVPANDVVVPSLQLKAVLSKVTQQCILFLVCLLFTVAFKHRPIIVTWNAHVFLRLPNRSC